MITYTNHKNFLGFHRTMQKESKINNCPIYQEKFRHKKLLASSEVPSDESWLEPSYQTVSLIDGKVQLSFHALPILFNLNGHDKNLIFFLLTYCIQADCTFEWNRLIAEQYADLCVAVAIKKPNYNTIRQSIVALTQKNIIQRKGSDIYMVNPLLTAATRFHKKEQIKAFSMIGTREGQAASDSLFVDKPAPSKKLQVKPSR